MDLCDLLKTLGLWHFFPEKLHRTELFSRCTDNLPDEDVPNIPPTTRMLKYMHDIVHFDADCRFERDTETLYCTGYKERRSLQVQKNKEKSNIHPLDMSTALFLSCDAVSRQDLVAHFWGCRHAFPLVIKAEQLEPPHIYIWPMKGLYHTNNEDEKPVLDYDLKAVSVLRFSKQQCSKSKLLNSLMTESEINHSAFFHRDCKGSTKRKSVICEGMIETLPVLNTKTVHEIYLNLRGNSDKHKEQQKFIMSVSDVVILICSTDEIQMIKELEYNISPKSMNIVLIIIFSDLDASDQDEDLHLKVESLSENLCFNNHIFPYRNSSYTELARDIQDIIKETNATCNEKRLILSARENNFQVDLDSFATVINTASQFEDNVLKSFRECIFPLQGDLSTQWWKTETEIYKLRHWQNNEHQSKETVFSYREKLEQKKSQMRRKQLQMIRNDAISKTRDFVEIMAEIHIGDDLELEIFLRHLKLTFDSFTYKTLKSLCRQYTLLINQHNIELLNAGEIEENLKHIDDLHSHESLSLTVFFREIGQIYETLTAENTIENIPASIMPENLTLKAVTFLLKGYHIEIMDGRTSYVPIGWIQSILMELHRVLHQPRIKVISVLGVQSSGKSTLLNIMFGSQFYIGSGRCTRGINMHLVKVVDSAVDYLIILDTEGLFSTSINWQTEDRNQTEREFATFVLGLSHITVLNIMGENMSYLSDILPISVLAFLRMDLVGLNSKCIFIRHGVDTTKSNIMRRQTYNFERNLDSFTSIACSREGVPSRRFKDVVHFNLAEDDFLFPPLFVSTNESNYISPAYSRAAIQLKKKLISDRNSVGTLLQLREHISHLWMAIRKDNFVYEFRNVIDIEARAIMDKNICYLQWKIHRELQLNESSYRTKLANCDNLEDLLEVERDYRMHVRIITKEQERLNEKELMTTNCQNDLLSKALARLLNSSLTALQKIVDNCADTCKAHFIRDLNYRKMEVKILKNDKGLVCQIDEFIGRNLEDVRQKSKNIDHTTQSLFQLWCSSLWTSRSVTPTIDYETDALNCICSVFFAYQAEVEIILQEKGILERNMGDLKYISNQLVQEISENSHSYVKCLIHDMKSMQLFYHAGIFRDILLEVRNHKHLREGKVRVKPILEIKLAASLCGEFIKQVRDFGENKDILTKKLMNNTECYFKRACRTKLFCKTNSFVAVETFSKQILNELRVYLLEMLPQEIALFLRREIPLLTSKQGLLYYTWIKLMDSEQNLRDYLESPVESMERCIEQIFDNSMKDLRDETSKLHDIVVEFVNRHASIVSERLASKCNHINHEDASQSNTMEICVQVIQNSLGNLLNLNTVRIVENDILVDTNASVIISKVSEQFTDQDFISELIDTIINRDLVNDYRRDVVRSNSVRHVLECLLGCRATCHYCGEVCCIGQEGHAEEHKAVMHRPIFAVSDGSETKRLTSCSEQSSNSDVVDEKPINELWVISSDVTLDDNSFWKYMFATFTDMFVPQEHTTVVPVSWKMLQQSKEKEKLKIMLERINEL